MRKTGLALAIIAPYAFGVWAYFSLGWPIWPGLFASCLVAYVLAPQAFRTALALAVAVGLVQAAKGEFPVDHTQVYYAAIYATIGVLSYAIWDKVAGKASLAIAGLFLIGAFADLPRDIIDALTEVAFLVGLIWAALNGPSAGIYTRLFGPARSSAHSVVATVPCSVGSVRGSGMGGPALVLQGRMEDDTQVAGSDNRVSVQGRG